MPLRPQRPCRARRCPNLTRDKSGYCTDHIHLIDADRREADKYRESATSRGYDWQWRKVRAVKLAQNPVCESCGYPADTVHHIQPVEKYPDLRLAIDNLMSLCRECHEKIEKRKR